MALLAPLAPRAFGAAPVVYADSLGSGWFYNPWMSMNANLSSTVHRARSTGIAISMTAPSGFSLQANDGFNTTGQQTLRFSILNVSGDVHSFYIALCSADSSPIHYVRAADYTGSGALWQNPWYDLVIPLADLQATNRIVTNVLVQVAGSANFYIDEISFDSTAGSSYWIPPTVTSVALACSPATLQPGGISLCSKTLTGTGNPDTSVTWAVNGVPDGNATVGNIDVNHLGIYATYLVGPYIAPSAVTGPMTVTVTATSVLDPAKFGSATISIVAPPTPIPPAPKPTSPATGVGALSSSALLSDANLLSYYPLDGNANDRKGGQNGVGTAIMYGANFGKFGQGAGYNGSSSYISTPIFFTPDGSVNI